jgi:DNA topoisomerase-2
MAKKSEPEITRSSLGANSTRITFKPDLAKFHMTHLDDDVVALMKKRVVDMIGFLGMTVHVMINGQRFYPLECFSDSVYPYISTAFEGREVPSRFGDNFSNKHHFECCYVCKSKLTQIVFLIISVFLSFRACERIKDQFEVCVTQSEGTFQQVNVGCWAYEQVAYYDVFTISTSTIFCVPDQLCKQICNY